MAQLWQVCSFLVDKTYTYSYNPTSWSIIVIKIRKLTDTVLISTYSNFWQAAVHGVAKSRIRLSDFTFMHWRRKWQPTLVFLPGESQGRRNVVGYRLWGHTESDTTEVTQQQHSNFSFYRVCVCVCARARACTSRDISSYVKIINTITITQPPNCSISPKETPPGYPTIVTSYSQLSLWQK